MLCAYLIYMEEHSHQHKAQLGSYHLLVTPQKGKLKHRVGTWFTLILLSRFQKKTREASVVCYLVTFVWALFLIWLFLPHFLLFSSPLHHIYISCSPGFFSPGSLWPSKLVSCRFLSPCILFWGLWLFWDPGCRTRICKFRSRSKLHNKSCVLIPCVT